MKSVKPGRGPSTMRGVGSVAAVAFGILWIIAAASMGAPAIFPLFGLCFVALGVAQAIYHFRNAMGKQRYSAFDVVDENEEPDPLNRRFGAPGQGEPRGADHYSADAPGGAGFCPWCGARAEEGYAYCRKCGRKLPGA